MQPPEITRRHLGYWLRRYGPQDLVAAAAAIVWCQGLAGSGHGAATLGFTSAVVETITFYAVAFARTPGSSLLPRGLRVGIRELAREYGFPELIDLGLRPTVMTLGVTCLPPAAGVALASIVADLIFYTVAARLWTRQGQVP